MYMRSHLLDALSLYKQLLHSGCIHYTIIMMTLLCKKASILYMHNILSQEVISCNVHNYNVTTCLLHMMIMDLFV